MLSIMHNFHSNFWKLIFKFTLTHTVPEKTCEDHSRAISSADWLTVRNKKAHSETYFTTEHRSFFNLLLKKMEFLKCFRTERLVSLSTNKFSYTFFQEWTAQQKTTNIFYTFLQIDQSLLNHKIVSKEGNQNKNKNSSDIGIDNESWKN